MTLRTSKFTPKVLISAPRRSAGAPSPDGTLILYTQTSYSFDTHSKTSGVYTLDVKTGLSTTITTDARAHDPKWLGLNHEIVWLKEGENGNTTFMVADAKDVGRSHAAGTISGPASNLKIHMLDGVKATIAFSCKSNPDGSLYNPKDVVKPHSSAMIYDSLFVRHWDSYVGPERNTIWTAVLQKAPANVTGRSGRWSLLAVVNRLKYYRAFECPIPPFGGTDNFDLGDDYLVLVSKYPNLNRASHTACIIYLVPVPDFMAEETGPPRPITVASEDDSRVGAQTSPVFSPDRKFLAWLAMRQDGYESDQNLIHIVQLAGPNTSQSNALDLQDGNEKWDRSPSSMIFSADGIKLYALAEDRGHVALFELDLTSWLASGSTRVQPRKLTFHDSISDLTRTSYLSRKLFFSTTSLTDSSSYYTLDPIDPQGTKTCVSSLTRRGAAFGLSPGQVCSISWPGAESRTIHAWMVKPSFFKAGNTYPLAYVIHGGPQGAWTDSWSTRWNPAVFAEQGYVVICPNPTGSTGYGQGFTDAIRKQWGGLPYQDLVKGIEHVETKMSHMIDSTRMVALGASYGGYMINWLQGQSLGRKFQALVCHDGVFNMRSQVSSDEQYFPIHDLGGPIWEQHNDNHHHHHHPDDSGPNYDRWDPSRFTHNWSTPQLVIHSQHDYRLPITEGLAAFNVLQLRGVPSRFLTFPDENHWVLGHENGLVWHTVVLEWINRHVGLPPPAPAADSFSPSSFSPSIFRGSGGCVGGGSAAVEAEAEADVDVGDGGGLFTNPSTTHLETTRRIKNVKKDFSDPEERTTS